MPALALYLLFVLYPVVQAVHYSAYNWDGLKPMTNFVGIDNYVKAFQKVWACRKDIASVPNTGPMSAVPGNAMNPSF